jgi:putative endonuclease
MTKSTKPRRPFKIIYKEQCENKIKARAREKYLKSGVGREFLKKFII